MKKILLVLSLLSLTCALSAQKVVYDKKNALNKRVMYTDWLPVNWSSDAHKLEVSMLLEGKDVSLMLNWQCQEMLGVERDSKIVLTFTDQSKVVLLNKAFSVSGAGKVETELVSSSVMGVQIDAKGDLSAFADKTLQKITINTTSGEVVFPITEQEAAKLNLQYAEFYAALMADKK